MNILVMGGTGAMGDPLVNELSKTQNQIYVTSRSNRISNGNIHYMQINAKNDAFLHKIKGDRYDIIIDFMVYRTEELKDRIPIFLKNCNQYFFFSSSRVYANSTGPITEESSRLLDVCQDKEYLNTDEYALAKAREEDLFKNSGYNNWTIIRPYITYNTYRLQLGVYEKEHWIKRAIEGRTIVFPKDIANARTTLTYGPDVSSAIIGLIGNEKAIGETFHVTIEQSFLWSDILNCYLDIIEKRLGIRPKVQFVEDSTGLQTVWHSPWQIKYDRIYNRTFDNSKIDKVRGQYKYKELFEGLEECLSEFLINPRWISFSPKYEAWCDRITHEWTPIREIPGKKNKIMYIKYRLFC
ncbi:MAG: NAD-dependent epimerase/dehydratase [Anaerocolumna sp.]|jgi:nucleoside-diphosphate-sugar epimerase|nr:NAD-dependent epimerase/dehydratase [Anaerocolumna sp.]